MTQSVGFLGGADGPITLREPYGRAHGDCGGCEIYHAIQQGVASEVDVNECGGCYFSGRPLEFQERATHNRSILLDLAREEMDVVLSDGSRLPAAQALELLEKAPAKFRLSAKITF